MPGARDAADLLYAEWVEKLHRITRELYSTHHYRELWRSLVEITQGADLPPSVFFDALGVWYGGTQAIAIRRQLDDTRGVVSLRKLLDEIARHPEVMTRERHVSLWGDPEVNERDANRNFDRFSGGADRIASKIARADLAKLLGTGEVVKRHVDEAIAHTRLVPTATVPTYADLNAVIDFAADLVKKYASLLEAVMLFQFEPVIQQNWKAIFQTAWLPDPE